MCIRDSTSGGSATSNNGGGAGSIFGNGGSVASPATYQTGGAGASGQQGFFMHPQGNSTGTFSAFLLSATNFSLDWYGTGFGASVGQPANGGGGNSGTGTIGAFPGGGGGASNGAQGLVIVEW